MVEEEEEVAVEAGEDGPPGWLTTFADLMSLLLTFFILLLSFSELNQKKFHSAIQSINVAFKGNKGPIGDTRLNSMDNFHIQDRTASSSGQTERSVDSLFMAQIQDAMQNDLNSQKLSWRKTAKGVKISAPANFFFVPRTTILKEEGKVILKKIIRRTRRFKFALIIKTHTDDRRINSPLFASNWEFSARRSTRIVRFIIEESKIPSSWARAIGLAASKPIAPNTTERNRKLNNRIELEYEIDRMIEYREKRKINPTQSEILTRKKSFTPRFFNVPKENKRTSYKSRSH